MFPFCSALPVWWERVGVWRACSKGWNMWEMGRECFVSNVSDLGGWTQKG